MVPRPSTSRGFSIVPVLVLGLSAILTPVASKQGSAQTSAPAVSEPSAKPGTVTKVKAKSKETWADMKARWAKQKERWAECQKREKAEKRTARATRVFLEDCMTRQ